jgi:hypothetical protein
VFLARLGDLLVIDNRSNYIQAIDFDLQTLFEFSILEKR